MVNLTLLSLSISSMYSTSPLLTGKNSNLQKLKFNFFYFPTIIYHPEGFTLKHSSFNHGIGSLIYLDNAHDYTLDKIDQIFNESFKPIINPTTSQKKELCMVLNCIFNEITVTTDNQIYILDSKFTFYMDSCTFNKCKTVKRIIRLNTRATTISHICCSYLHRSGNIDNEPLLIQTDTPRGSFMKMIESTYTGTNSEFEAGGVMQFSGEASFLFQNINFSNFKQANRIEVPLFQITTSSCINIQMSTFQFLNAAEAIYLNPNGLGHYIGFCNFLSNTYTKHLMRINLNGGAKMVINQSVFTSLGNGNNYNFIDMTSSSVTFILESCEFETSNIGDCKYENVDCTFSNPKLKVLQHFTNEVCNGPLVEDPIPCDNDTCSEEKGCPKGAFDFDLSNDVPYPPVPDPTVVFTNSLEFTNKIEVLTESEKFSQSLVFTDSKEFTKSDDFTESELFSQSNFYTIEHTFSDSNDFSGSNIFTLSGEFTSKLIIQRSVVNIEIKNEESNQSNKTIKICIGVACGVAALAAIVAVGIFFLRKRKLANEENIDEESIDITDDHTKTMVTQNPLKTMMDGDDPFEEEFDTYFLKS